MRPLRLAKTVRELPLTVPFVGPEAIERRSGVMFRARLGANENIFGPSPASVAAMEQAARENWKYGDPENHDLRHALAIHHGVTPQNVMIGEGIDGLLGLTVQLLVEVGEAVVTSDGAYPTFNSHVTSRGGRIVKVPMRNDHEDLSALLAAAVAENARLIYVSNPNNPMGTYWSAEALKTMIDNLPQGVGLILDEAYCDTAPDDAVPQLNCQHEQVLRFRTFSKAYGLAGARIGYVLGPESLIPEFDKVRNRYGINRLGQIGALAALHDQTYLIDVVRRIADSRRQLMEIAAAHDLPAIPSGANFVAIDLCGGNEKSEFVMQRLLTDGVFIRRPSVAPLNRCIRVSCGDGQQNQIFADGLNKALIAWASRMGSL